MIILGISLAIIPVTALASYLIEPVEQKTMSYRICDVNGCKTVAEITPPNVPRYQTMLTSMNKTQQVSQQELQRRQLLSEIRVKEMMMTTLKGN